MLAATAALAFGPTACGGSDDASLTGVVRQPPLSVGEVQLVSADGGDVTMTPPAGELLVASFGYTVDDRALTAAT